MKSLGIHTDEKGNEFEFYQWDDDKGGLVECRLNPTDETFEGFETILHVGLSFNSNNELYDYDGCYSLPDGARKVINQTDEYKVLDKIHKTKID